MMQTEEVKALRSGALAEAVGVSTDTIRHYERLGILPRASRTASGYRLYPATAVERVLIVRRALRIGFSLPELAEVLKARDDGGAPCRRVYELAQGKLECISNDIRALRQTEKYLKKVLADWQKRLITAKHGQKSHLLYSLSTAPVTHVPSNQLRRRKDR